jgi:hypothetical protein
MFELLAFLIAAAIAACLVFGGLVLWVVTLPFRILGFFFGFLGFLLAVPFILLAGMIAVLGLVLAALLVALPILVLPLLPVAAMVWLIWWLLRRRPSKVHAA